MPHQIFRLRRPGSGTLLAFRTDREAVAEAVPHGNRDISIACESLDEFLWSIARYELVKTDRAHVMIAVALLGKEVHYCPTNYHKLPGLAAGALQDYPVLPFSDLRLQIVAEQAIAGAATPQSQVATSHDEITAPMDEFEQLRALAAERERTLNDILNSRSFRIVSFYWRLRREITNQLQRHLGR